MSNPPPARHRSYQVRGYCTRAGYRRLDEVLGQLCDLGNAALQERRDAWRVAREQISFYDQCRSLTQVRRDDPDGIGQIAVVVARGALQRVDRAFQAFFRRCRQARTPGYPRFKSRRRYTTIEVNDVWPSQVSTRCGRTVLRINGLPIIRLRPTRPLPDEAPKAIRIMRRDRGVDVGLVYPHDPVPLPASPAAVGIDLGIRKRLALSTGEVIERRDTADEQRRIRRVQRAVSRCRRRSNRRRKRIRYLAHLKRKQAVRNRNACHRITTGLVRRFGRIFAEDLDIPGMTRSAAGTVESPGRLVSVKRNINRMLLDQTWGLLRQQLAYKAEWAGREYMEVSPELTTQRCSGCGAIGDPGSHERWRCSHCGARHDRDLNAAINIHRAGIEALGSRSRERVAT